MRQHRQVTLSWLRGHRGRHPAQGCEAFLEGRYVEHLLASGQQVPPWAWMNLLAHATADELARVTNASRLGQGWGRSVWHHARAYLAGEVLDAADRRGPLEVLQVEVLVPLELELMSRWAVSEPSPSEWVTGVLAALGEHDRVKHRYP